MRLVPTVTSPKAQIDGSFNFRSMIMEFVAESTLE